jgi:hypothetical protein
MVGEYIFAFHRMQPLGDLQFSFNSINIVIYVQVKS